MTKIPYDEIKLTRDAVNRGFRSLLGGIFAELVVTVMPELIRLAQSDPATWDWNAAHGLGRIAAVTVFSYVLRRYGDPSPIPTPLPPQDPGRPAVDENGDR